MSLPTPIFADAARGLVLFGDLTQAEFDVLTGETPPVDPPVDPPAPPPPMTGIGLAEARPAPESVVPGFLYRSADTGVVERSNGVDAWAVFMPVPQQGGGGWVPGSAIEIAAGTAAEPGLKFAGTSVGLFANGTSLGISVNGTSQATINTGGIATSGKDLTGFRHLSHTGKNTTTGASGAAASRDDNAALLTLSTAEAFTDSLADLLPAGARIDAVVGRVITAITGATTCTVGDPTNPARFGALASLAAGSVFSLIDIADREQIDPAKVRLTFDQAPGAGSIRVVVFYTQFTAPVA